MANKKSSKKGSQKTFASKRTINPTSSGTHQAGNVDKSEFQQHDAKRRLGSFERAGEHARTGNPGHS